MEREISWKERLELLVVLFTALSFAGWIWEVALHLMEDGEFVKRGVLSGPWLPIYGAGGVLIVTFLGKYKGRPGRLFLMIMGLCGVMEYAVGWYLETVYHTRWWDYSELRFQIQGRVCLAGLLIFGIGGVFLVYKLAPAAQRWLKKVPPRVLEVLCLALVILFAVDFCHAAVSPNMGNGITTAVAGKLP